METWILDVASVVNESCFKRGRVLGNSCSKSIQIGFSVSLLHPTLSFPQFVRTPSVQVANVTLRLGHFKAEGSLDIFRSDGLIFRLDKRDRRDATF